MPACSVFAVASLMYRQQYQITEGRNRCDW